MYHQNLYFHIISDKLPNIFNVQRSFRNNKNRLKSEFKHHNIMYSLKNIFSNLLKTVNILVF